MSNYLRGHKIKYSTTQDAWIYADTGDKVEDMWKHRPCNYCGLDNTPEGHDGCLGTLPHVKNACCGHGQIEDAYVQLEGEGYDSPRGQDALDLIEILKRLRQKNEFMKFINGEGVYD